MYKKYIIPAIDVMSLKEEDIICTSPGVNTGDGLREGYNKDDVTYSKGSNTFSFVGGMDDDQ